MYFYSAFGLTIDSDLELTALADIEGSLSSLLPVLTIRNCTKLNFEKNNHNNTLSVEFAVDTIGIFSIRGGEIIEYRLGSGIELRDVVRELELYLLGSCMGAALWQQGNIVLHGNGIEIGRGAVICLGASGAGKSTLAAEFAQQGFSIISDDVCCIASDGRIKPGYPRIKLWGDSAELFGVGRVLENQILPQHKKFNMFVTKKFCKEMLPIRAIYNIVPAEINKAYIEPLVGGEKLIPLLENVYRPEFMTQMDLDSRHFLLTSALASDVDVRLLFRPISKNSSKDLVDLMLSDVGE